MQDISGLLRQAHEMQDRLRRVQEDLSGRTVEGSSGGGMVRVVCSGDQKILSLALEPGLLVPEEREMLQDLVVAAVNDALRLSRALMEQEMGALAGILKPPFLP
ncbi:MAG: YbaB/EbfC family nucleoid-associated protein [Desulfovibrio sp.]|jgi:DNA-binding YbaB/EbfC family protein|nr:YbaB/EbfC family nucleoid-associated protein [Desulfovibrio sp.]